MKNISNVVEKYKSNPEFKRSFNEVVFSYFDEIMPNQTKSEQLKEFVSNKDRNRFIVKAANLIDNIDQDLSDEMIGMELDSIKTKLKNADKKLGLNAPEEVPTLNNKIIRSESPEAHYDEIRSKIRSALDEAQENLSYHVKERYGDSAGFNEYQRNKDEFERYGMGFNPSREFEAERFGNADVDSVREEFEERMNASKKKAAGNNYDNGLDFSIDPPKDKRALEQGVVDDVDLSGAKELLSQRSVGNQENNPAPRSNHRLRRGHD